MGARSGRRSRGSTARTIVGEVRGSSSRGGPTGHAAEGEIHNDSGIRHSWRQVFLLCAGAFRSGIASTAYILG